MPVIDKAALDTLRDLQDDEDPHMLRDLIMMFLASAPEHLKKIALAITKLDSRALILESHTLKSSSANLGALQMRDACFKLEKIGHSGVFDGAAEMLKSLEDEYRLAAAELQTHAK